MFQGISEQTKKEFEKYNSQGSNYFVFSFADLELVEKNGNRRKCRLLSDELSQKLCQIYSQGKNGHIPPIKFIDFEIKAEHDGGLFFYRFYGSSWNYGWWLKLNKKNIQENSNLFSEGTLKFNFVVKHTTLNTSRSEEMKREEDIFCRTKAHQTTQARSSALTQIKNTIKEGNIDSTTLADAGAFLGESYVVDRPSDCLHCNDPEELTPERWTKYYETHIKKCVWRPDRINQFKENQIALIKKIIDKFNDYKNQVICKIINCAQEQGLTETKLNNNRPNWQTTLRSLTNRQAITNYQTTQLEEDIKSLIAAKNKSNEERQQAEAAAKEKAKQEEERLKNVQAEQAQKEVEEKNKQEQETKTQAKQQALTQKREQILSQITQALHQEPSLSNSELSPQYQNWETQLNQLTDFQKMTSLQDRVLADIQARRQDKISAQKTKENIDKVKTGTKAEQQQAWKDLENQETQKGYQENQEEINNLKKQQATEDPTKYAQEAHQRIEEKLRSNEVKIADLTPENQAVLQKLKEGQIQDPTQLVTTETNLKENIYQVETTKKITDLTSRVNQVLQSKSKSQISTLKKELLAFLSSSNIYYTAKKKEVEQLLSKLENFESNAPQNNATSNSSSSVPWKVIIPILIVGILVVVGMLALQAKRIARKLKKVN